MLHHTPSMTTSSLRLYGVDGCPGGWVVAAGDETLGQPSFCVVRRIGPLLGEARDGRALVAIDVPIGLPTCQSRACDLAARVLLGRPRASSVFPAPCRAMLRAARPPRGQALRCPRCGKCAQKQLDNILPKIGEVDDALVPGLQDSVREAHPEVVFAELAGWGAAWCTTRRRLRVSGSGWRSWHGTGCASTRRRSVLDWHRRGSVATI
jgi:predicted RNase H-like nuclease